MNTIVEERDDVGEDETGEEGDRDNQKNDVGEDNSNHEEEVKKIKIAWRWIVIFLLVFFRFSSSLLLAGEILFLTLAGICINLLQIYPSWINIFVAISVFLVYIFKFFDSYQQLYCEIYKIVGKIDCDEKLTHKEIIFKHDETSNMTDTLPFYIEQGLLKQIINKHLPFKIHFWNTFWHIIVAFLAVGVIAGVVIVIDQTVQFQKWIEYAFTLFSLALVGLKKMSVFSGLSESRKNNKKTIMLTELENDLKTYAQTGKYPEKSNNRKPVIEVQKETHQTVGHVLRKRRMGLWGFVRRLWRNPDQPEQSAESAAPLRVNLDSVGYH